MTTEILTTHITENQLKKAKYISAENIYITHIVKNDKSKINRTYEMWKIENNIPYVKTGHKMNNENKEMTDWVDYSKLYIKDMNRFILRINDFIDTSKKGKRTDIRKSGNSSSYETVVKIHY